MDLKWVYGIPGPKVGHMQVPGPGKGISDIFGAPQFWTPPGTQKSEKKIFCGVMRIWGIWKRGQISLIFLSHFLVFFLKKKCQKTCILSLLKNLTLEIFIRVLSFPGPMWALSFPGVQMAPYLSRVQGVVKTFCFKFWKYEANFWCFFWKKWKKKCHFADYFRFCKKKSVIFSK